MSLRLVVLRHGSTDWNEQGRYQGCKESRLSAQGRAQAEAAARLLADREFSALYASPLSRAQETAGLIAERRGCSVLPAPAFREICLGVWEGLTRQEVQTRFPALYADWRERPHTVAIPDGETVAMVQKRVLEGLTQLRAAHEGETICLVAHGVTIRLLILEALGLPTGRLWSFRVSPAAVSEIEYGNGWATVHRLNVPPRLDGFPPHRHPLPHGGREHGEGEGL